MVNVIHILVLSFFFSLWMCPFDSIVPLSVEVN